MNVKYVIKIQPNISNQIQSGEMCAKKIIIIKATKRKEKKHAILCCVCCVALYLSIMQGSLETPLPWLIARGHLRVFTTITITVIIIIIARVSQSSRTVQVL